MVLDPDNRKRLDDKLRSVIKNARVTPGRNAGNYKTVDDQMKTLKEMLKPPSSVRRPPAKLEPLGQAYDDIDVVIDPKIGGGTARSKQSANDFAMAHMRRGSQMMPESSALEAVVANNRSSRQGASTNRSQASNAS